MASIFITAFSELRSASLNAIVRSRLPSNSNPNFTLSGSRRGSPRNRLPGPSAKIQARRREIQNFQARTVRPDFNYSHWSPSETTEPVQFASYLPTVAILPLLFTPEHFSECLKMMFLDVSLREKRSSFSRKKRRAPSFPKAPFIISMAISRILSGPERFRGLMIIHLIRPARGTNARRIFIRRGATIPED